MWRLNQTNSKNPTNSIEQSNIFNFIHIPFCLLNLKPAMNKYLIHMPRLDNIFYLLQYRQKRTMHDLYHINYKNIPIHHNKTYHTVYSSVIS